MGEGGVSTQIGIFTTSGLYSPPQCEAFPRHTLDEARILALIWSGKKILAQFSLILERFSVVTYVENAHSLPGPTKILSP